MPAEGVAARRRAVDLALPGQLERARRGQPLLPVARVGVGRGPRPWAARRRAPAPRGARRPASTGSRPRPRRRPARRAARSRRPRWSSAGGRREDGRPHLGGIAQLALLEPRQVRGQASRQLVGQPCRAARAADCALGPVAPSRNSLAGSRSTDSTGADAALVGRVEGAQRLDLVAEPLDAHGQRLAGREDVDDAAAARELAPAADLGQGLVAQLDELAQHALLADALARLELERLCPAARPGQACAGTAPGRWPPGRCGTPDAPRRESRHAGGALVAHQLASARRRAQVRGSSVTTAIGSPSHASAPRRRDRRSPSHGRSRPAARRWRAGAAARNVLAPWGMAA